MIGQLTIPGVDLSPTGVTGLEHLDAGGAERLVRAVDVGTSAMHWVTGDVAIELMLRARLGDRSLDAVEMPQNQALTARCVRIALRFPHARRRSALTWSHHELVAGRPEHHQDRLLDLAEAEGLTVRALRALMAQEAQDARPELDGMPVRRWKPPPRLAQRVGEVIAAHPNARVEIEAAVDAVLARWTS